MNENRKNREKKLKIGELPGRANERGAALVIVIVLAFVALLVATMSVAHSFRALNSLENEQAILAEKWETRGKMAVLSQIMRFRTPTQFQSDYQFAKTCTTDSELPPFDKQNVTTSVAVVKINDEGQISCADPGFAAPTPTSLLGSIRNWTLSRKILFLNEAVQQFNIDAADISIVSFDEAARRFSGSEESGYVLKFLLDARAGNYRTRNDGEILLATGNNTCGTYATLDITPTRITRGQTTQFYIRYSAANRLRIYNSAGNVVHDATVTEQIPVQTYTYTMSPNSTDSYYVEATGSGACSSRTPTLVVAVDEPPPVCPVINLFEPSSTEVNAGDTVQINWNVTDAFEVTLQQDSNPAQTVAASGTRSYVINAETTFILRTRDSGNICPQTRTITIRLRPPTPCSLSAPTIQTMNPAPSSITPGSSSVISYNISSLVASNATLTGPNGFSQGGIGNGAGNITVTPPAVDGDYTYTLTAVNTCPDGTQLITQRSVVISVRSCPIPVINSFTINPTTVYTGGNETINLAWNISGAVDSVTIDNGVGGGLGATGSLNIPQPQTTTIYTLTVVGCGQTRQISQTVVVQDPPSPTESCNFNMDSEPICSITNANQCGPHKVQGSISNDGSSFTFQQTHSPFASFGQGFFQNIGFALMDGNNRTISSGGIGYTDGGSAYWVSQPAGAGPLYQNTVTVTGNLPAGTAFPLHAIFTVGYGPNAGSDSKSFDTRTSPGGCGVGGSGTCSRTDDLIFYCEEHTNAQFSRSTTVTFTKQNGRTFISVALPIWNYPGGVYAEGQYTVSGPNGFSESKGWSTNPSRANQPGWVYVQRGLDTLELDYPGTSGYSIQGNYWPFVSDCTIIPPGNGFWFQSNDSCEIAGLFHPRTDLLEFAKIDEYLFGIKGETHSICGM